MKHQTFYSCRMAGGYQKQCWNVPESREFWESNEFKGADGNRLGISLTKLTSRVQSFLITASSSSSCHHRSSLPQYHRSLSQTYLHPTLPGFFKTPYPCLGSGMNKPLLTISTLFNEKTSIAHIWVLYRPEWWGHICIIRDKETLRATLAPVVKADHACNSRKDYRSIHSYEHWKKKGLLTAEWPKPSKEERSTAWKT